MKYAEIVWTLFIIWINFFVVILIVTSPDSSYFEYGLAAACMLTALKCMPMIYPKDEDNKDEEIKQFKIKLSVMTQERDSCFIRLDHLAKQAISQ